MTITSIHARFNAAKLLQSDLNSWRVCSFVKCREKETCLGGARGTCSRSGGWPLCTKEGQERVKALRPGQKWKRSKISDTETQLERGQRRLEDDMRSLDILLKAQGV